MKTFRKSKQRIRRAASYRSFFGVTCICLIVSALTSTAAAQTWTFTGNMNTARNGATGTLLSDGRFLVAGGTDSAGNLLASAEIYAPATGTWTLTSAMVHPQLGAAAVLLNDGRVLVYGGNVAGGAGGVTNLAQMFDPSTGLWTATGSMNQCRQSFTGILLANGQAMAVGGYCFGYLSSVEIYNPSTGNWSYTGELHGPGADSSATLLSNGKVLVTGGTTGFSFTKSEVFDPSSGNWTLTDSLNQARAWGGTNTGTILLNSGQVLAVGGKGGSGCGSFVNSAELYDPIAGTWDFTGSLPTAVEQHRLVLLSDGRVLSIGGLNSACTMYFDAVEVYDPSSGDWSATASLNQARALPASTRLLDGRVLVAGGYDGATPVLASAEIIDFGPTYTTQIQPPIQADGSSIFSYRRGVIPVKFILMADDATTCDLPPATIALYRTSGASPSLINEADYIAPADTGSSFRISNCQYIYNVNAKLLGPGAYRVTISISGTEVGSAIFAIN